MNRNLLIALTVVVAGCAPIPFGGSGTTDQGGPLAAEVVADPTGKANRIFIRSPANWECSAKFASSKPPVRRLNRNIPLLCNDGRSGTAVLSLNQQQQQMTVSFRLSDGEAGQVIFGLSG